MPILSPLYALYGWCPMLELFIAVMVAVLVTLVVIEIVDQLSE